MRLEQHRDPSRSKVSSVADDDIPKGYQGIPEEDQKKAYVMVEFVIDKNGKPGYTKVIKGGNDEMNDRLIEAFDKMPDWLPAIRQEMNVAVRLKQSLYIERVEAAATKTTGSSGGATANN